jgi:hypothetical protein
LIVGREIAHVARLHLGGDEGVEGGLVDGILIIDAGLFACTGCPLIDIEAGRRSAGDLTDRYSSTAGKDARALWGFLCCLSEALHGMTMIGKAFTAYGRELPDEATPPSAS